jgi:hypothetical protein
MTTNERFLQEASLLLADLRVEYNLYKEHMPRNYKTTVKRWQVKTLTGDIEYISETGNLIERADFILDCQIKNFFRVGKGLEEVYFYDDRVIELYLAYASIAKIRSFDFLNT